MDKIVKKLELPKATNVELAFYPGEKGLNGVLTTKAPLTYEAAKVLGCEVRFYDLNETPFSDYQGRMTVERIAKQVRVTFGDPAHPGATSLLPDMAWKFSIGLEKDGKPSVSWRMHFDSQYRDVLVAMVNAIGKSEIAFEMVALQQTLFEEAAAAQSGDGVRVDLSGKADNQMVLGEKELQQEDIDTGCVSCNNDLELDPETGIHKNGSKCTRLAEPLTAGTLASAREVAGGTTAAARKARGARRPVTSITGADDAAAGAAGNIGEFPQV